jgi:16S rRNA G1207 methylase RsmC
MGRPKLTEFLLRLATDVEVFEKFKKGNNKQRADLMQVAELVDKQVDVVLKGDSRKIVEAVMQELEANAAGENAYSGATLAIVLAFDRVQFCLVLAEDEGG